MDEYAASLRNADENVGENERNFEETDGITKMAISDLEISKFEYQSLGVRKDGLLSIFVNITQTLYNPTLLG